MNLPFKISQVMADVTLDCELLTKVCHFTENSGTGKTWLFNLLLVYCEMNGISHILVNYANASAPVSSLIDACSGKQMIFLDNADLYDSDTILSELRNQDGIILVSYHGAKVYCSPEEEYTTELIDNTLRVRQVEF